MKKRIVRDLSIVLSIGILALALSYRFDLFERFVEWSRKWERHQLDELVPTALVLAGCLIFLLAFRWGESRYELAKSRRAEAALRENVERLTSMLDGFRVGIIAEDKSRRVIHLNHAFCDMFGIDSPDSAVESDRKETILSLKNYFADPEGYVRVIDERFASGKLSLGNRMMMTDGRTIRVDFMPVETTEGHIGNLWLYRDVTGGRRVEDACMELRR